MPWWCAHCVYKFVPVGRKKKTDWIYVWEDVYLVHARSEKLAWARAKKIAKQNEDLSGTMRNGEGTRQKIVLAGIRNLISCSPPIEIREVDEETLRSGTEATYMELIFRNNLELNKYLVGDLAKAKVGWWSQSKK